MIINLKLSRTQMKTLLLRYLALDPSQEDERKLDTALLKSIKGDQAEYIKFFKYFEKKYKGCVFDEQYKKIKKLFLK